MNRQHLTILLLLICFGCVENVTFAQTASKTTKQLQQKLTELRTIKTVASSHVGVGGSPSEFGLLGNWFLQAGTESDYYLLLGDSNPVVRSMGLYCLAQRGSIKHAETLKNYVTDNAPIDLMVGCIIYDKATVGTVAKLLLENPNGLNFYPPDIATAEPLAIPIDVKITPHKKNKKRRTVIATKRRN